MNAEKILVTGGSGYLGGFVVDRLRQERQVTVFDRVAPEGPEGVGFVEGDITVYDEVKAACEGMDAVVHLVALVRGRHEQPHPVFVDVMVKGTWNVAQACVDNGVPRLINISSIVACGRPVSEQGVYRVGDPSRFHAGDLFYCLSKSLGEHIGTAYHQAHGLSVIHLRPGVIEGDGANPGPKPPEDRGHPWFMYVHPEDIARAVDCALNAGLETGTYNIVAGRGDSRFDWITAKEELGYAPQHNWPEIEEGA